MVIQYGWGPDDSPAIYFCNNAVNSYISFSIVIYVLEFILFLPLAVLDIGYFLFRSLFNGQIFDTELKGYAKSA